MRKAIFVILGFMLLNLSCRDELKTVTRYDDEFKNWIPAFTRYSESDDLGRILDCYNVVNVPEKTLLKPWEKIYPSWYGGIYRDWCDQSRHTVLLTDTSKYYRDQFLKLCQIVSPEKLTFELCDYSSNDLRKVLYDLHQIWVRTKGKWDFEIGGIDDTYNRVHLIFRRPHNDVDRERFKKEFYDSPMVIYFLQDEYDEWLREELERDRELELKFKKQQKGFSEENAVEVSKTILDNELQTLTGGCMIGSESYRIGRIGYCACDPSDGNAKGFITACHVSSYGKVFGFDYRKQDTTHRLGVVTRAIPGLDMSFCKLDDLSYVRANHHENVCWVDKNTELYVEIIGGQGNIGGKAKILNLNPGSVTINNEWVYGVIKCCLTSAPGNGNYLARGDSGTLVRDSYSNVAGIAVAIQSSPEEKNQIFYMVTAKDIEFMVGLKVARW